MLRQNLTISNYNYIVDIYKYNIDKNIDIHFDKWYILRNPEMNNGVAIDKNVYLIDNSIIDKCLDENNNVDINKLNSEIGTPIQINDLTSFSCEILNFNESFFSDSFGKNINGNYNDLIPLQKNDSSILIPCDEVRIYHPHIKSNLDAIISVDNYIGDVHFYYFCRQYSLLKNNSECEFKLCNQYYSEYSYFYIPNVEYLFDKDNEIYFINEYDDLNNDQVKLYLFDFLCSYTIEQDIERSISSGTPIYYKKYNRTIPKGIENYRITFPINIVLYPYSSIDYANKIYVGDESLQYNSDTFLTECKFTLSAEINFNSDGAISVLNKFNYPNKDKFVNECNLNEDIALQKAYFKYNNVTIQDYINYTYPEEEIEKYEDEDESIEDSNIKLIGYHITLSSDLGNSNILYSNDVEIKVTSDPEQIIINNFAFNLNNIFSSWDQLPEILVINTRFEDHLLGNVIYANFVGVTKEHFKYFINKLSKDNIFKIKFDNQQYYDKTEEISKTININNLISTNFMDISKGFNFIDKLNCVINSANDESQKANITNNSVITPKIIYKPIFFKTQELQNIKIKNGVVQNIGINLGDFMSKVEKFKMNIDGQQLIEYARNDVFVIFSIPAGLLTNLAGSYIITNEDDEYISDGNWSVY